MKVQYHITPAQIQNTHVCLQGTEMGLEIPSAVLCYADVKLYGDTNQEVFIHLPNIALIGLFYEIRGFLQSDKASSVINGWWDYQYAIELSLPRKTSLLTLNRGGTSSIQIKPPTLETMSKVIHAFLQSYIRHVPQLASYPGLEHWEKDFDFKIRR